MDIYSTALNTNFNRTDIYSTVLNINFNKTDRDVSYRHSCVSFMLTKSKHDY